MTSVVSTDRDGRFNFAVLTGDVTCFFVGMAFLDTSTALPALVARLGGAPAALALLTSLRQAGYYLPQLFVAHRLQGRTRYQPFLLKVCALGRIWMFAAALAIYLIGNTFPNIALTGLIVAYCLSWMGDGMGGVPWTAIVGKAVPLHLRGRLFATTQILAGFGRLGVGALIKLILSERYVTFPTSGALLVLGSAIFLAFSWAFLALIREPAQAITQEEEPPTVDAALGFIAYLRTLPVHFRTRPDVARLALVQILISAATAVSPFLFGHAEHHTPNSLPIDMAGTFLMVQTIGLLLCAPILGGVTDRYGPRRTLLGLFTLSLIFAGSAALGAQVHGYDVTILPLFFLSYFCLGASSDAWTTITNYLLEAVPEHKEQATFIALMNASSAPVLFLPLLLGQLVQTNGSATMAFIASVVLLSVGVAITLSLPDTRKGIHRSAS